MDFKTLSKLAYKVLHEFGAFNAPNPLSDKAYTIMDLYQELITKAIESSYKYKSKSKETTFIYSVMKNHLLNLIKKSEYRTHSEIDFDFGTLKRNIFEYLTKEEFEMAKDAIKLFNAGLDKTTLKYMLQRRNRKVYLSLRNKIQYA